jgi:glutathione S-transferase
MWRLYQFPLCPFSRKVRLVMGEKGIAYELWRENPWDMRDEFLNLNPAGGPRCCEIGKRAGPVGQPGDL